MVETALSEYLKVYLSHRPFFLSLIRAKEAYLFQRFLPFRSPVLDIGCGDGFFAKVAFQGIDIGLDVPDSRMEEARTLGIYKKLVRYDGVHMPFKTAVFKTAVSNCVLEHVSKLPEVLSETQRVLARGGRFLTTVMAAPWEEYMFGTKFFGDSYRQWMRRKQVHLNLFTQKQWDKTFQHAGFKIEERIGYLPKSACTLLDVGHYLSVPSLLSYKLFHQWVLSPALARRMYPIERIARILAPNVEPDRSGAIFYVLRK